MTQPASDGMSAAYHAADVQLKVYDTGGLTEEEARAWLAQTVPPSGEARRTIDTTEEVQGA
jgi:hypothetical protein